MRCKDLDKLIHLYWDQKLYEKKRKEVEKHLSECQRCKEKFEALKIIEEKARRIKIPEPEEVYWESFSQRVRQKIISKQKQPFGVKVKGFFSNIFVLPPTRLKLAVAIASLILVFIVGKLYIDYRGTIPERIKYAEKGILEAEAPKIEKEITVPVPEETPPPTKGKKIEKRKAPETKKGAIKGERVKLEPKAKPEPEEVEPAGAGEMMARKAVTKDIGEKAPIPEVMEQEVTKPVERAEAPKAAMRVMADVEEKKAKPRSKISFDVVISETMPEGAIVEYLFVDSIHIPDVDYRQKVLSADSLRVIIDFWSEFIKENPEDIFVEIAYLQIAASYYYLFDKIKDEAVREKGIKQIEEFLKRSKEEETKKSLKQRLEKLKGSKEK